MNKAELISHVASGADISMLAAERVVNSFISQVIRAVSSDDIVQIIGLGSFAPTERSARMGRNPVTGAAVMIGASKSVKFKAGSAFKDAVNSDPL
jgi:nucleoid DNA-binding protein